MFKATQNNAKALFQLMDLVGLLVEDVIINVNSETGLTITTMDTAHICLVHLNLKVSDWDLFEASEVYNMGIKMSDFLKLLKRHKAKDSVTLSHNPKENKLKITFTRENSKKDRHFYLKFVDVEDVEIQLDALREMEFENSCTIQLEDLYEAVGDAEVLGNVIQINSKDNVVFSTESNVGDMEFTLYDDELVNKEFTGETTGIFAISYLKYILKARNLAKVAQISLKTEAPLKVEITVLTDSELMYFLAPRVDTDDDVMMED